jgi:hypothetical protein
MAPTQLTTLRDYGPTGTPNSVPSLAGKTICLTGFNTAFPPDQLPDEPMEAKTELDGYEYVEVTDAEDGTLRRRAAPGTTDPARFAVCVRFALPGLRRRAGRRCGWRGRGRGLF